VTSDHQVAVVTGGSRGIGAAVVRRLVRAGHSVVFTYRAGGAAAEALEGELRGDGGDVSALEADAADPSASREVVRHVVDRFGRLDIAVSNAGVEHFGALSVISLADYDRVFATNVAGQLFFVQAAVPAMADGGRVVLMSSISGSVGVRDHTLYGASKAAVMAMARNLAPELADLGLTINAVAPGGTQTDMGAENGPRYTPPPLRGVAPDQVVASMTSAGRWATPDEIAAVVEFLVSPSASYVSGSTIPVNGGWIG
jgi:3-oxoacyl-[acyl-carrier protein] reductase